MENHGNLSADAVGFCLLPSELIQNILLYLALPEIISLKTLNKSIAFVISDQGFIRECNSRLKSSPWLFLYRKRWRRDAILHGFTDQSSRWFKIPITDLLKPVISPYEDLYFLTADGNVFLFASNTYQELMAVNLLSKTVQKIPPSPLGPRGTSSWRRSGMKLVPRSDHFRFLFAELAENRPVLFVFESETENWKSIEAQENVGNLPRFTEGKTDLMYLSVINGPRESVWIAVGSPQSAPILVRPRFNYGQDVGQVLAVGYSWGNVFDRLHVCGDGYMMIVRSNGADIVNKRVRMVSGVELWGLGSNGTNWELISMVPGGIVDQIKKAYGVMMGCLEERGGIIRTALMSHFEGSWDIIWLSYDTSSRNWTWVPVPDCKMKGLNMAGVGFSSGLTLS